MFSINTEKKLEINTYVLNKKKSVIARSTFIDSFFRLIIFARRKNRARKSELWWISTKFEHIYATFFSIFLTFSNKIWLFDKIRKISSNLNPFFSKATSKKKRKEENKSTLLHTILPKTKNWNRIDALRYDHRMMVIWWNTKCYHSKSNRH